MMLSRNFPNAVLVFALLGSAACSKNSNAPSSTPSFAFAGETTTPAANTFWIDRGTDSSGQIAIRLNAHFTQSFSILNANLVFDKAVLTPADFTTGDFLKQGGADVTTSVTFPASSNNLFIDIERPDSVAAATGDGVMFTLRFKAASGASKGASTPIEWNDSHAYTSGFTDRLVRTYGATVTLQ